MKYKNLQILTIVLIIIGCVVLFISLGATSTFRHIPIAVRYTTMYSVYICIVLTAIVFIVYPILYLRKAKQKKQVIIKPTKN